MPSPYAPGWRQTIASINTAGTLYNTFTTAKSMLTSATATGAAAGVVSLPADFFQIGTALKITFTGGMSWASGNLMTFDFRVGAVIAYTSGALKVTTTGGTTEPLFGEVILTCRSIGNGTLAQLMGAGMLVGRGICPPGATAGANYTAGMGSSSFTEGVPTLGTGFDSTVANTFDFFLTMGTSSASNGFQLQQYDVVWNGI